MTGKIFNHLIFFTMKAKLGLNMNVAYQLRDAKGNIKPLYQENTLARLIRKMGFALPKISLFGNYTDQMVVDNLVTNTGFAGVASRLNGNGAEDVFDYIALGIGTTAANVLDTALESEITTNGGERAQATATRETTDVTNDTAVLTKTFTFTGSFAVTETGVLNAASEGTLLARQVFSAINVASGDSLQITWKFDID